MQDEEVSIVEKKALRFLFDVGSYPVCDTPVINWPITNISAQDEETLYQNKLLKAATYTNESGYFGYMFTVTEAAKERRRLVHDTLSANVLTE